MLEAYFDDSGTHGDSEVVVWGGLIGHTKQWEVLEKRWRQLLAQPLPGKAPLKQFHLSHCAQLNGDYRDYSRAESDLLRWHFRQAIADAKLEATAYAVSRNDWHELVQGRVRRVIGAEPEAMCIGACLRHAFDRADQRGDTFISVTMDQGRRTNSLDDWIRRGTNTFKGNVLPISVGFAMVADLPGLQAADTIATETFWAAKAKISGKPKLSAHFKNLLGKIPASGNILDRDGIRGAIAKIAANPRIK